MATKLEPLTKVYNELLDQGSLLGVTQGQPDVKMLRNIYAYRAYTKFG